MRLENKVAIVTGASSGLGRKIAQFYGREGAKVVVSDIREDPLPGGFDEDERTTVDSITSDGGTASFVRADVTELSEVAALRGGPRQSVYNMSKGAQALLTKCLAVEYGHEGIRVNGICPTYAKTALTRELFDDLEFMRNFEQIIPLQRWGEAEDVANLAVFLASDESSYIHGALIPVDGGEIVSRFSV